MKYFFIFLFILIFFNFQHVSPFNHDNDITFDDEEFMFNSKKLKRSVHDNYFAGSGDGGDDEYETEHNTEYRIMFHVPEVFETEYYDVNSNAFINLNDEICASLEDVYLTIAPSNRQLPCSLVFVREADSFLLVLGVDITLTFSQKVDFEQALISTIQYKGGLGKHSSTIESFKKLMDCDEFLCFDQKCISKNKQCDNVDDCSYGEDEINCVDPWHMVNRTDQSVVQVCQYDEFVCDSVCRSNSIRCNRYPECSDGKDEENCTFDYPCPEAKCNNGDCVLYRQKCDGRADCSDKSDEHNCCRQDEFKCGNGICIPERKVCDSNRDCFDNSDELNCPEDSQRSNQLPGQDSTHHIDHGSDRRAEHDSSYGTVTCYPGQFSCTNQRCISESLRCNRRNDCGDNSDEVNCPNYESRPNSCHPNQFTCENRKCIPDFLRCDGRNDCGDNSDERNCSPRSHYPTAPEISLRTYPGSQKSKEGFEVVFRCRDEGPNRLPVKWSRSGGRELPPGAIDNNGRLEIPNIRIEDSGQYVCQVVGYGTHIPGQSVFVTLSVEKYKLPVISENNQYCNPYNESTCMDGITCIDRNFICDGRPQCPDSSDEFSCSLNKKCQPNQFICRNGKCVAKFWRCDGENDCGDNSDEESCGQTPVSGPCKASEFQCRSGHCIPRSFHCDQTNDCADGTDEIGCQKPVVIRPPPPSVTLPLGGTLNITCHATGNPTPEIVWRLNWNFVPKKCFAESSNGFGTLICRNMEAEDSGAYSCEMINSLGPVFVNPDTFVSVITEDETCNPGTFETLINNEKHCSNCFCSGVTNQCRGVPVSSHYNPITVITQISKFDRLPTPEPQYIQNLRNNNGHVSIDGIYLTNENLYIEIPSNIVNQQLSLFGSVLKYNIRFNGPTEYNRRSADVILVGSRYNLFYYNNELPSSVSLPLYPGKLLKANNNVATNEEIITTLSELKNILIRISYSRQINVVLSNISTNSGNNEVHMEFCSCPPGYSGSSCEKCDKGYSKNRYGKCIETQECPSGTYLVGKSCTECPCPRNGQSYADGCSVDNYGQIVCNCRRGYTGRRCDMCASGYIGNPLAGVDCVEQRSNCNKDGTQRINLDGSCLCKPNTEGPKCDRCKPNAFFLNANSEHGCINCFCMGVSSECQSSTLSRDTIYSRNNNLNEVSLSHFHLADSSISNQPPLPSTLRGNELFHSRDTSDLLYWNLPFKFLGNKVKSYGGFFNYTLRYAPSQGGAMSKNAAADVIIKSANEIEIQHFRRTPLNAGQSSSYYIPLFEQFWQRKDRMVINREYFLMALSNIEAIYIKATYTTTTSEVVLNEVSMDIAVENYTGRQQAQEVEECVCPEEYTGLSCEYCAQGFTRNYESGLYLGSCERCQCNGNSEDCDPETRICKNCQNHSTGSQCEQCEEGFVKQVISSSQFICQRQPFYPERPMYPKGSVYPERPTYPEKPSYTDRPTYPERPNYQEKPTYPEMPTYPERPSYPERPPYSERPVFPTPPPNSEIPVYPETDSQMKNCYCSGTNAPCSQQSFRYDVTPIDLIQNKLELYEEDYYNKIDESFFNFDISNNSYTYIEETYANKYWSIPEGYLGNMIKHYGGRLEYELRVDSRGRFIKKEDIIVQNADGSKIYWQSNTDLTSFNIVFSEQENWFKEDGSKATKTDIMAVLSNVNRILIRASQFLPFETSSIGNIVLYSTSDIPAYGEDSNQIEVCSCPRGYMGTSCEQCDRLYYRNNTDKSISTLGSCHMCPCQIHVESCSLDDFGRISYVCMRGYTGYECKDQEGRPTLPSYTTSSPQTQPPSMPYPPYQPEISELVFIEPSQVDDNEGSNIKLACQSRQYQPFSYVWYKDNKGVQMGQHIFAYENVLIIRSAMIGDSGEYKCEARYNNNIFTSTAIVNIRNEVNSHRVPQIRLSESVYTIPQHENYYISCNVTGYPEPAIRWSKIGDSMGSNAYQNGNQLVIMNADIENRGNYLCMAENDYGTDETTILVDIDPREKPSITLIPQQRLELFNGDTAYISYRVTGSPVPTIQWRRQDGLRLPQGWQEDSSNMGQVQIYNVSSEDAGLYECVAINDLGTVTEQIEVIVFETPKLSLDIDYVEEYTEGDEVDILCKARGNPTPFVRLECENVLIEESDKGEVRLHIPRVTKADAKEYVCIAQNNVGEDVKIIPLIVKTRRGDTGVHDVDRNSVNGNEPLLHIPTYVYKANIGDTAILKCDVDERNHIPTRVTWERIDQGNPPYTHVEGNNLVISNIGTIASGIYQCNGIDYSGKKVPMIRAHLQILPIITIHPQIPVYVTTGQTVELTCNATGADRVKWYPEHDYFLNNVEIYGNMLRINSINADNEGKYLCNASNLFGEVTKETSVHVQKLDITTSTEQVYEGDTVTLRCDPKYTAGNYRYKWRSENYNALQNYIEISQPILRLPNVYTSDAGKYFCDVFTLDGQIVSSLSIDLRVNRKYR